MHKLNKTPQFLQNRAELKPQALPALGITERERERERDDMRFGCGFKTNTLNK